MAQLTRTFVAWLMLVAVMVGLGPTSPALAVDCPQIDVWYGPNQTFGAVGTPQKWVNILGNADGVPNLSYSLDSATEIALTLGSGGSDVIDRRLAGVAGAPLARTTGDFNVDIDATAFAPDTAHTVDIVARDASNVEICTEDVTVNWQPYGDVQWPLPTYINWPDPGAGQAINDFAQIVDGQWEFTSDGVHTAEPGYDRLIAIGEWSGTLGGTGGWNQYEVTVPVTIHSTNVVTGGVSGDPAVGILTGWDGHTEFPVNCLQPECGWRPFGTIAWWHFPVGQPALGELQLYDEGGGNYKNTPTELSAGTTYMFKLLVEESGTADEEFHFKVWNPLSESEPAWQLNGFQANDRDNGSILLLSHHLDVTFGDVCVTAPGGSCVSVAASDGAEQGSVDGMFTVSRTGGTTAALSVLVDLTGSSATAPPNTGFDYVTAVPNPVIIPAGQSSVDVIIDPVDDSEAEDDETVELAIVADVAYAIGSPAAATVTIVDNDPPEVSVAATDGAEEASVDGVFTLSRTGPTTEALSVTVDLTGSTATAPPTAGFDYVTAVPNPVIIPIGQASVDVVIDPVDDGVVEGDETVELAIVADAAYQVGTPAAATVTITENDLPEISVTATDGAEEASVDGVFTLSRTGPTTEALSVAVDLTGSSATAPPTAGFDYVTAVPNPVIIPAGQASVDVMIDPVDDSEVEDDETVNLAIVADAAYAIGTPSSAIVTITENDLPVVSVTATDGAEEASVDGVFTLSRTGPTMEALSVAVDLTGSTATAPPTAGFDYVTAVPNPVIIPIGQASVDVTIDPVDDGVLEGDETVELAMVADAAYQVGTPAAARVVIVDGAPSGLVFVPVSACVLFDTRPGQGSGVGPLGAGSVTGFSVFGDLSVQGGSASECGVPSDAVGVFVNLVAVNAAGTGHLEIAPAGSAGGGGVVNFADFVLASGRILNNSNAVPVALNHAGPAGEIEVSVLGAATHVRGVVLGFFAAPVDAPDGLVLHETTPCAVFDTRTSQGGAGPIPTGTPASFDLVAASVANGCPDVIPAEAVGVYLNVVAPNPQGAGNLKIAAGGITPDGGVVNYQKFSDTALAKNVNNANALFVEMTNGVVDVHTNGVANDARGIVLGYLMPLSADSGGLLFHFTNGCTAFDTTTGGTAVIPGVPQSFDIVGSGCAIPSDAAAVFMTLVAADPLGAGNFKAVPGGVTPPLAGGGVVNYQDFTPNLTMNNSNAIVIGLSASGFVDVHANAAGSHTRGITHGYWN